jgi:hypothetical protein
MANIRKKFLLPQLQALEENQYRDQYREGKFQQYKKNLSFMVKNRIIDWNTQKSLFKFATFTDARKWITDKLSAEGLL